MTMSLGMCEYAENQVRATKLLIDTEPSERVVSVNALDLDTLHEHTITMACETHLYQQQYV